MNRRGILRIVLFIIATGAIAFAQTTINVPSDVPTIQAAIDVANNGDRVVVAPGTYVENIDFRGKAITVVSSGGVATTIIDGGGAATVVTFNHGETANAVLSGFTIRNGTAQISGGGIKIANASPTIESNVITGNHAIYGIGVDINGGSPVIKDNVITDNHQCCGTSGFGGGGINVQGSNTTPAAPLITGNTITNNSVANGGFGGGIDVTYFSSPVIQNNYIAGNRAYNYGGGVNISSYRQTLLIQNIITNNGAGAGGGGGGVSFYSTGSSSLLLNNTLYGNQAFDGSSEIATYWSTAVVLANNAVSANYMNALTCNSGQPTVSHNVVYSQNGSAFAGDCSGMGGTNGNVTADPLFVDPTTGDFHLQAKSPAVDAGDNSAAALPVKDFGGNNRIVDGDGDGNATVDMGAYEYDPGPVARISPTTLAFGNQNIQTYSAPQTATLTNVGTAELVIQSFHIDSPFLSTNNCGASLAPGAGCTFSIVFAPNYSGSATGALAVLTNAAGPQPTVALSGSGVAPVLALSTNSLSFLSVLVGATSASQPVVISNPGDGTLEFTGFNIVGAAEFAAAGNCGSSLAPGASCTMNVTYSPVVRGQSAASFYINVDAPATTQHVALYGVGVAPVPTLPTSVSFGPQPLGTTSTTWITLSNTGDAGLMINAISAATPFAQTNDCPPTLAAGSSCSIQATFSPTLTGLQAGSLTITDNAGTQTVALSGSGVDFALSAAPATVARGDSIASPYTVSPVGGPYSYAINLACSGLPRGASCSFAQNPVNPGANALTSAATFATSKNTPVGTYQVVITGTSITQQHSVTLTLTVTK